MNPLTIITWLGITGCALLIGHYLGIWRERASGQREAKGADDRDFRYLEAACQAAYLCTMVERLQKERDFWRAEVNRAQAGHCPTVSGKEPDQWQELFDKVVGDK